MITTKVSASEIENSLTTDPSRTLRMPPFPEVIEGRNRLAREIHDTEVLQWVAAGKSKKEIRAQLSSPREQSKPM
jgi:hypothetical protein